MNAIVTNISNGIISLPQGVSIAPGQSVTVFLCFDVFLSITQEGDVDHTIAPPAGVDGEWLKQWNNVIGLLTLCVDGVIDIQTIDFDVGLGLTAKGTHMTLVNPFARRTKSN